MKRKKQGSSLIFVVIIFMFVTVVSGATLSMVSSNYAARVSENKRIQNLYGSESGLDVTYNIIAKNIEAANIKSKKEIDDLKEEVKNMSYDDYNKLNDIEAIDKFKKDLYALYADIDYWKYYNGNIKESQTPKSDEEIKNNIKNDEEYIDSITNLIFKHYFKKFIDTDYKINDLIEQSKYIQIIKNNDTGNFESHTKEIIRPEKSVITIDSDSLNSENKITWHGTEKEDNLDRELQVESGYDEDGKIKYAQYTLFREYSKSEESKITVKSEFETDTTKENTATVGKNKREIQAQYVITVPNYNEVAFKESAVNIDEIKEIPGLTIGQDLIADNVEKLNVNGDIFVQGNEPTSINNKNRTYEKYNGGIILNKESAASTGKINFNDNVYTRGTFNIKSNVEVKIKGDLYARNIYAGNGNQISSNSKLDIMKDTVVDNDLALKAEGTEVTLNNFYGINDKTVNNDDDKVRKSSSIIINDYGKTTSNPSSITINNEAYIMGVAHIDTEDGYQTGESVAVKGNYEAYGSKVDSSDKFKYDNPLQVLDEDDVNKKAEHFKEYWDKNNDRLDCGGVVFKNPPDDNIKSVGAIVYEGENIIEPNIVIEDLWDDKTIAQKRRDYVKNIYKIVKSSDESEESLKNLYNKPGNAENLELYFTDLGNYNLGDEINKDGKKAIFSSGGTIILQSNNIDDDKKYYNELKEEIINPIKIKSNNINAVIVTGGDVIIDGEVNFRGNIIAEGKLSIESQSKVNLYYDKNVTEDIQKSNGEVFNKVFESGTVGETIENNPLNIQSNSTKFVKTKLWKIIK